MDHPSDAVRAAQHLLGLGSPAGALFEARCRGTAAAGANARRAILPRNVMCQARPVPSAVRPRCVSRLSGAFMPGSVFSFSRALRPFPQGRTPAAPPAAVDAFRPRRAGCQLPSRGEAETGGAQRSSERCERQRRRVCRFPSVALACGSLSHSVRLPPEIHGVVPHGTEPTARTAHRVVEVSRGRSRWSNEPGGSRPDPQTLENRFGITTTEGPNGARPNGLGK